MLKVRLKGWVVSGLYLYLSGMMISCIRDNATVTGDSISVKSPDSQLTAVFHLKNGIPFYSIMSGKTVLLNDSRLGLRFNNGVSFDKGLSVLSTEHDVFNTLNSEDINRTNLKEYNSLLIALKDHGTSEKRIMIDFRLYNDKIKFRYRIPQQVSTTKLILEDELTEFSAVNNFDLRWDAESSELQQVSKYSKIVDLNQSANVPLTLSYGDSFYMTILEEPMHGKPKSMKLINNGNNTLKVNQPTKTDRFMLQANSDTFLISPWRVIKIVGELKTS